MRIERSRLLFVRGRPRTAGAGIRVFVVRSTQEERWIRRLELERHAELLDVDLLSAGEPVGHPLFLVCTHGKHDRCCAKFGRPLYDAVCEGLDDEWAWQSTHVGGDRFAGNLVGLPDGVYHGRVEPGEAWTVLEAALEGRVHLPRYRGRSCHSFPAQAAERAVRELDGLLGVDDVSVRGVARADNGWAIELEAAGRRYDVAVERVEGELTHLTCSAERLSRPAHWVAGKPRVAGTPRARGA